MGIQMSAGAYLTWCFPFTMLWILIWLWGKSITYHNSFCRTLNTDLLTSLSCESSWGVKWQRHASWVMLFNDCKFRQLTKIEMEFMVICKTKYSATSRKSSHQLWCVFKGKYWLFSIIFTDFFTKRCLHMPPGYFKWKCFNADTTSGTF